MSVTTIKVPTELRDRLYQRARGENITLAATIARLLDSAEERAFWDSVQRAHDAMSDTERATYMPDDTLTDNLDDEIDDNASAEDAW